LAAKYGEWSMDKMSPCAGRAVLFDGRTWHASHNEGPSSRTALILQYARTDTRIRKPDFTRLEWPFKYLGPAPCLLVSGSDTYHVNKLVEPPA
jgi:ectoine hydroxylase-related dioxygenase (phytanoyl-CoA dioxygenase family)